MSSAITAVDPKGGAWRSPLWTWLIRTKGRSLEVFGSDRYEWYENLRFMSGELRSQVVGQFELIYVFLYQ